MKNFGNIFGKVLSFFRILTICLIILTTILGCIKGYLNKEQYTNIHKNVTTSCFNNNYKNEYIP